MKHKKWHGILQTVTARRPVRAVLIPQDTVRVYALCGILLHYILVNNIIMLK